MLGILCHLSCFERKARFYPSGEKSQNQDIQPSLTRSEVKTVHIDRSVINEVMSVVRRPGPGGGCTPHCAVWEGYWAVYTLPGTTLLGIYSSLPGTTLGIVACPAHHCWV